MALGVGREGGLAGQGGGGADGGASGGPLGGHGGGHLALGHQAALVAGVRHQLALRRQRVVRHAPGRAKTCTRPVSLVVCMGSVPVFYTWIHV